MSLDPTIISEDIQDAASVWLARRDRGLTAAEQDAYLEWLYASPSHGRAIVQLERVWGTLNKLEQWRPAHSATPNPDLLLPRRSFWAKAGGVASLLSAVAAIAMAFHVWGPVRPGSAAPRHAAIIHPGAERQTLADGSIVELNQGAKIDVHFTEGGRRVRLLAGEAHFTVAHNAARPFFVDTGKVSVRAIGTAFSVALGSKEVAVLVTEGKVQVIESSTVGAVAPGRLLDEAVGGNGPYLTAGQRVVVSLTETVTPAVQDVTPAEMDRALSWQAMRLEFVDMPLGDVAVEFNRYNRQKLTIGDDETAAILVGGNFRADNVEAFVRLLDSGFGVTAFRHGEEIVLRKTR